MISPPQPHTPINDKTAWMIHVGARLLRRVLGQVLRCRFFRAALSCDPSFPLCGPIHRRNRAGLTVVKRLFRLWLWIQAEAVAIPQQTPTKRGKLSPKAMVSHPSSTPKDATTKAYDDPILAALSAQGFRPKLRIWDAPKRKKRLAGSMGGTPNLPSPRVVYGVKAGQAYMDLQHIAAILASPDRAIMRLARHKYRVETKRAAAIDVYAKPPPRVACPVSPTVGHLRRFGDDPQIADWVRSVKNEVALKRRHPLGLVIAPHCVQC